MQDFSYKPREHKQEVLNLLEELALLQKSLLRAYAKTQNSAFKERFDSIQETKSIIKKNNYELLCRN